MQSEMSPQDERPEDGLLDATEHDNPVEHPTKDLSDDDTDDLNTDEAVDDIVEKEGDEVLTAEDAEVAKAFTDKPESFKEKLKRLYQQWWDNKKLRYATFAGFGVFVLLIGAIPPSRYFMLNAVGVRSRASIVIMDDSTDRPLKNVQVTLGKQTAKTDTSGKATFTKVRLGRQTLKVEKRAFAATTKAVTIGWGSNPLGNSQIHPVGAQYVFYASDWLSGKPVATAEASSGEFDAVADKDGKIVLTIDASDDEDLDVTVRAKDYRDESVKLDLGNKAQLDVKLVTKRKEAFISKRSGKYDLYKIDVDAKNEQLVLAGTGNENENLSLVSHPTDEEVALVSTRDNTRNKDGYLLSTLTVIDLDDNSTDSVTQSEDIRVLGWSGDRLVFVQVVAGTSAGNPKRQRLVSYDYKTDEKLELASSNNFNDLTLIGNTVYYAPGNLYNTGVANHFYSQRVDGANKTSLLEGEIWNVFRTSYDELTLSGNDTWYSYSIGDTKATRRSGAPTNLQDRTYTNSPDGKNSLWVDERDGKNTLLLHNIQDDSDKTLKAQAGLMSPIRWLNNTTLIYRIQTPGESADYVMSINGGEAQKIRDVTRALDIWH